MQLIAGERKPSWRDAPEWAIALNHGDTGEWFWSDDIDVGTYRESRPGLAKEC